MPYLPMRPCTHALLYPCASSLTLMSTLCPPTLQARWVDDNALLTLPHLDPQAASRLTSLGYSSLALLADALVGPHSAPGQGNRAARGPEGAVVQLQAGCGDQHMTTLCGGL